MQNNHYQKVLTSAAKDMIERGQDLIRQGQNLMAQSSYTTISVLTRWCNDEMIAPFFLDHYAFADEIVILLSGDTTDKSREIISQYQNTRIIEFEYTNGFNGREANAIINKTYRELYTDWVIGVDADELVFAKGFQEVREVLQTIDADIVYADFWQVYRHHTEMDLDPSLKALWLRRHGDPNRTKGPNGNYRKPVVVRSGLDIKWGIGLHNYETTKKLKISNTRLEGAHWRMADPKLAIARRMRGRRENVSEEDIKNKWSFDNFDVTEEEILKECEQHLNDPQLF